MSKYIPLLVGNGSDARMYVCRRLPWVREEYECQNIYPCRLVMALMPECMFVVVPPFCVLCTSANSPRHTNLSSPFSFLGFGNLGW